MVDLLEIAPDRAAMLFDEVRARIGDDADARREAGALAEGRDAAALSPTSPAATPRQPRSRSRAAFSNTARDMPSTSRRPTSAPATMPGTRAALITSECVVISPSPALNGTLSRLTRKKNHATVPRKAALPTPSRNR